MIRSGIFARAIGKSACDHYTRLHDVNSTSKMATCLVQLGCSLRQRINVMAFCTRKGYCKEGYCKYRPGDLTPHFDKRYEVFELTSIKAPSTPCIDDCCPGNSTCSENATVLSVRQPGRRYRKEESRLPPRECVFGYINYIVL